MRASTIDNNAADGGKMEFLMRIMIETGSWGHARPQAGFLLYNGTEREVCTDPVSEGS